MKKFVKNHFMWMGLLLGVLFSGCSAIDAGQNQEIELGNSVTLTGNVESTICEKNRKYFSRYITCDVKWREGKEILTIHSITETVVLEMFVSTKNWVPLTAAAVSAV